MNNKLLRIGSIFLVLTIIYSLIIPSCALNEKLGDLDNNAKIEATDALITLQGAVGKLTLNSTQKTQADVDGNSKVEATDALLILQYSVSKISSFPAEKTQELNDKIEGLDNTYACKTTSTFENLEEGDIRTLYQINGNYSSTFAVDTDCFLAYVESSTKGTNIYSWKKICNKVYDKNKKVGIMICANRDGGEYLTLHPELGNSNVQTASDGSFFSHLTCYYMVPTLDYAEYKWQLVKDYIDYGAQVVAIEEPEFWNGAGYSQAFKEEWVNTYGIPWVDQTESAEAAYMTQKLKSDMFEREIKYIADKIKDYAPNTKVLVATHSVTNYINHGISTGISKYANLDSVDGIIGQSWSDSCNMSVPYAGTYVTNQIAVGMFEYNSYKEFMPEGKDLYLLQDPAADSSSTSNEQNEKNYKTTLFAMMMQQDTQHFENTIWPQRAYSQMTQDYKNIQLSTNKMLTSICGQESSIYTGTKGVAIGLSDTASWHITENNKAIDTLKTVYGIVLPLFNDGIPVDTVCLDTLTSIEQLNDVKLLILSYDSMKPLSEDANSIIAQWVKNGGSLMYLGGTNAFDNISDSWWNKKNTTPLEDLISKLDLNITVTSGVNTYSTLTWSGNTTLTSNDKLKGNTASNTNTFSGTGYTPFIKVDNKDVGIFTTSGKGNVTIVGIPSSFYSSSQSTENYIKDITTLTMTYGNMEYTKSSVYAYEVGKYFGAYGINQKLKTSSYKTYVNLYDSELKIVTPYTSFTSNTPILLYDVSDLYSQTTPALAYTNGVETGKRIENNSITQFTVAAPSSTIFNSRIICNNYYAQKVTGVNEAGQKAQIFTSYDENTKSLLLQCKSDELTSPITITIEWGKTKVSLDTDYTFESFTQSTKGDFNNDEFLYEHNCHINDSLYFCDGDTYATWRFDLETIITPTIDLEVFQNYVVSISFDNKNWTTIADYSKIGEFTNNGGNNKTITINSLDYIGSNNYKYLYVKLSSCYMDKTTNPGQGWGGSITSYTITYLMKK